MKILLTILFFAGTAHADVPYWQAPQASTHTAYGTGYASGQIKVYPSTTTAVAAPSIWLDGINRILTVRNGANVSSMSATGFAGNLTGAASSNVLKAGDTMTGQLTILSSMSVVADGYIGGFLGVGRYPVYELDIAGVRGKISNTGTAITYWDVTNAYGTTRVGTTSGGEGYIGTASALPLGIYSGNSKVVDIQNNGAISFVGPVTVTSSATVAGIIASSDNVKIVTNPGAARSFEYSPWASNWGYTPSYLKFTPAGDANQKTDFAVNLWSGGGANYDRLFINGGTGNVGIGEVSPLAGLQITRNYVDALNTSIKLKGDIPGLSFETISGSGRNFALLNQYAGTAQLNFTYSSAFGGNPTNVAMTIEGDTGDVILNNNVGIGTAMPAAKLHVQDGVVLSSTTAGFGVVQGYGSSGGCLMFRDTDNAGWTECKFLDGVMSCATDADGVCD